MFSDSFEQFLLNDWVEWIHTYGMIPGPNFCENRQARTIENIKFWLFKLFVMEKWSPASTEMAWTSNSQFLNWTLLRMLCVWVKVQTWKSSHFELHPSKIWINDAWQGISVLIKFCLSFEWWLKKEIRKISWYKNKARR